MLEACQLLSDELDDLHKLEESYWHARARVNELRDGDKNTAYFYHKANQRGQINSIEGLVDEDGVWHGKGKALELHVERFFGSLFKSESQSGLDQAMEEIVSSVSNEMNMSLDQEPTDEEIKGALFQMHPNKAPGPDGMHALFFQKFWPLLGKDIILFVKSWSRGSVKLHDVNKTCVVLIPKCKNPKWLTEFRPISCCNVLYKIISKTLANKLKPLLGDIISLHQSAFVPKRLITDNALIALEIFHAMKRKNGGKDGTVALKLDMKKAYDRVEWSFLEQVMYKMGFCDSWVHRIIDCLSSVSFSFKINGKISGSVLPSRGLRQGDPISPYLFICVAEAFSSLLSKAAIENHIHGVKVCHDAPRISHLFFADDSILFAKASVQECSVIADIISKYERASGQRVNLEKTDVVFSKNVSAIRRQEIVATLGVNEVAKHEKYLGLPTIIGKSKKVIFAGLKERIWKQIQGWKEKCMSRPGKETLIKGVVQSIPTYMMGVFKIPDGLLDEIHSMLAQFWWGSDGSTRKLHWHCWEDLCKPKSMGGMGFRDLKVFNQALLAKQIWRLHTSTNSLLLSVLKARYFRNSPVLLAYRGYDPSYSWRSLWGAKSLLLEGLSWRVGNGANIAVWSDSWLPGNSTIGEPLQSHLYDPDLMVNELIDMDYGGWSVQKIRNMFSDETSRKILSIPLSITMPQDKLFWWPSKYGEYSVKTGYLLGRLGRDQMCLLTSRDVNSEVWRTVWGLDCPPKLRHFIWRACKGSLAVKENLFRRHIAQDAMCSCCDGEIESVIHVLFHCTMAKKVWEKSNFNGLFVAAPVSNFSDMVLWLSSKMGKTVLTSIMTMAWAVWFCRNKRVYEQIILDGPMIAAGFLKLNHDYGIYATRVLSGHTPLPPLSASRWTCPPSGLVKINIDAHIVSGLYVGLGVVIRGEFGQLLLTATKRLEVDWDSETAEAAATRYGLQIARRFGFENVWLDGDAMNVIRRVDKNPEGLSPICLIYDDICNLTSFFNVFVNSHVKRVGNSVAHLVARKPLIGSNELICMSQFPQSIKALVELDLV